MAGDDTRQAPQVLVLLYSYSGQTSGLVRRLVGGLEQAGCRVWLERLTPLDAPRFPVGSIPKTLKFMLTTLLRRRVPIKPLSPRCDRAYQLVILAGPTWSYNPSGPVLSLLDRDGRRLFASRPVLALISCRGYWRLHWRGLKKRLRRCGAAQTGRLVFDHPQAEPWRTIGVFLKIAGRVPERMPFLAGRYQRFGHSAAQLARAGALGRQLGEQLCRNQPLDLERFQASALGPPAGRP